MLELLAGSDASIPAVTILIVAAGMLVLGFLDVIRLEVETVATVALGLVAIGGLIVEGVTRHQWLGGVLAAAFAFGIYLVLGMRGVMGGGDVKLAPVPALVLGVVHPLLALWWVSAALGAQTILGLLMGQRRAHIAGTGGHRAQTAQLALPHVPAMALAMLIFPGIFVTPN